MNEASRYKLSVVDDDRGLLRLIEKSLKRSGHEVVPLDSGAAAVSWLSENSPDLLLLDLKLQDSDAPEIIRKLSEKHRLPPFLIITGQGDERVAVEMMKNGALDYVVKDAHFQDVLPAVVTRTLAQIHRDRKLAAAEDALRISEHRFRVALQHSPIFVFNQDTDLRYTWIHNLPVQNAEESFIGKTDEALFPQEEADRLVQIKLRALATGGSVRQEVACTINGEKRIYDLTVEPVRNEFQKPIGITGAAIDITEHKRLENEVLQISEMEQRRIGQDLHDGICQHLAGIGLMTEALGLKLEARSKANAAQVENIATQIREVISQTRSLARGLSPVVLEAEGLMAALEELAAHTGKLFRIACEFICPSPVEFADLTAATHLFRIAQEAVTNAVKHGKAKRVEIRLEEKADKLVLAIRDNGLGFTGAPLSSAKGMGLRIMQYRATTIGATLLFQKANPSGAAVICFLPRATATESIT